MIAPMHLIGLVKNMPHERQPSISIGEIIAVHSKKISDHLQQLFLKAMKPIQTYHSSPHKEAITCNSLFQAKYTRSVCSRNPMRSKNGNKSFFFTDEFALKRWQSCATDQCQLRDAIGKPHQHVR